jgi:hypothetical protein
MLLQALGVLAQHEQGSNQVRENLQGSHGHEGVRLAMSDSVREHRAAFHFHRQQMEQKRKQEYEARGNQVDPENGSQRFPARQDSNVLVKKRSQKKDAEVEEQNQVGKAERQAGIFQRIAQA